LPINVSRASISRWLVRIHPYRQVGNKERSQIVGIDLLQLVNFIIAYPDATIDEMIVFMYNQGGELYSQKVVSQRLKELDITKKKASIEAYQAQRQHVQFRVELFLMSLFHFDEFGVTLEKCNRTQYGLAVGIVKLAFLPTSLQIGSHLGYRYA
jgi:arginine repressor